MASIVWAGITRDLRRLWGGTLGNVLGAVVNSGMGYSGSLVLAWMPVIGDPYRGCRGPVFPMGKQ